MLHTNGWIRVWAIEKSISIDASILKDNDHVITSLIIPNLNNNDVFWRNLEKGRMDAFLIQLGSMFNSIRETPDFIRNLLVSIELMSCPTAIFFVVSALRSIAKTEILNSDDVPLLRRVVLKARYIPHKSIRIITIRNLIVFYAKITRLVSFINILENFKMFLTFYSGWNPSPRAFKSNILHFTRCHIYNDRCRVQRNSKYSR